MAMMYRDEAGSVVHEEGLIDQLAFFTKDVGKLALMKEKFRECLTHAGSEADFAWSVKVIKETKASNDTRIALTEAMSILNARTADIGQDPVPAHEKAREFLNNSLSAIEANLLAKETPEGNLLEEEREIIAEYDRLATLEKQGKSPSIFFGVPTLDEPLGGIRPSQLVFIAAYSSEGKSALCVQAAWSAAVEQGKNVVYFTAETGRAETRLRLLARHSRLPHLQIEGGFLNTRHYKQPGDHVGFRAELSRVLVDMKTNPNYGKIWIVQVSDGMNFGALKRKLYALQRGFNVDMAVIDSLYHLKPDSGTRELRHGYVELCQDAQVLSSSFDGGRGLPIVSPWQVNRMSRDRALQVGYYTTLALAESAEATNSADVIISLLGPEKREEGRLKTELITQILKNRDGPLMNDQKMEVHYASNYFTPLSESFAPNSLGNGSYLDLASF